VSDWETGGLGVPILFAAVEIQDKAKARLFADLIVSEMGTSEKVVTRQEDRTTYQSMAGLVPMLHATVALNDNHLIFRLNPATVKAALSQAKAEPANVPGWPDYEAALKTVSAPKSAVLPLERKTLFKRIYEKLKPMAA
jgi:hypothetical protein